MVVIFNIQANIITSKSRECQGKINLTGAREKIGSNSERDDLKKVYLYIRIHILLKEAIATVRFISFICVY